MTTVNGDEATGLAQTLSRGVRILEYLAEHRGEATIPQLVAGLGLHRSIVYRLLRTLEEHGLVARDDRGQVRLGLRLAALAASVEHDVQSAALPELRATAEDLGATCFLAVLDRGVVVTLASVEPSRSRVTVAENPGSRHPLGVGAPGRAVVAQLPAASWPAATDRDAVAAEVRAGYATSHDEVIAGLRSVAVPLPLPGHAPMAVAVVYVTAELDEAALGARLQAAAARIRAALDA